MWCVFSKHGYLLGSFVDVNDAIAAMARWRDAHEMRFCEVELGR